MEQFQKYIDYIKNTGGRVSRCCPGECKEEGMDKAEAIEWLEGKRSMANLIPWESDTWHARVAQADAAKTEQAYWVLRAHKDGLI